MRNSQLSIILRNAEIYVYADTLHTQDETNPILYDYIYYSIYKIKKYVFSINL